MYLLKAPPVHSHYQPHSTCCTLPQYTVTNNLLYLLYTSPVHYQYLPNVLAEHFPTTLSLSAPMTCCTHNQYTITIRTTVPAVHSPSKLLLSAPQYLLNTPIVHCYYQPQCTCCTLPQYTANISPIVHVVNSYSTP